VEHFIVEKDLENKFLPVVKCPISVWIHAG